VNARRHATFVRLILIGSAVLALSGCGRLFGTSLAGTWSGTFTSSTGGSGILLLDLDVAGESVSGTWESSFTGAIINGSVTGLVDELVVLQLTPAALPDCPYNVVATHERTKLSGTYSSACVLTGSGNFSLEKK